MHYIPTDFHDGSVGISFWENPNAAYPVGISGLKNDTICFCGTQMREPISLELIKLICWQAINIRYLEIKAALGEELLQVKMIL